MAIRKENEITLRVISDNDTLKKYLKNNGFIKDNNYYMDDSYFIPKNINVKRTPIRDILSASIIIRKVEENGKLIQMMIYKIKNINENDEIIDQNKIECKIDNIEDAKRLLEAIGYYEIMNIKEKGVIYNKDDFTLTVKYISNGAILIEAETNEKYDNIEKLKSKVNMLKLPVEEDTYFVKKAEEELKRILENIK